MAEKKSSKEAKTFVSLLASRFKEDKQDFASEELRSYLTDAVSNLPKSKVKTALQRDFDVHFKHLSSILHVASKTPKQNKDIPVSPKIFELNIYGKEGLEKAFKILKESTSSKETDNIYKVFQASFPYLTSTKKIFDSLRETRSDDLSLVQKCTEMTIGCHTKNSILECLSFILEEFSSKCEACINEPKSSAKTKRVRDLQATLHKNIVLINHRWMASSDETQSSEDEVTSEESYEDLMAAMLSLYTDMQLVSSSITEESSIENLASLIFAILGHSPEHCMDVLLQVTQLDCHNASTLIPLLRCILERNHGILKITQYIKFISLARIGLHLCSSSSSSSSSSSTKTKLSIRKIAEKKGAPARFVSIVSKHNRRLAERLQLSKKLTSSQVTSHLLGEQREEDIEALLDLASESREESDQRPAEDHGPTDDTQGDQATEQPLFFFDSAGGGREDEDATQRVDFDEHEGEDAIIHRQLKTIIGQLQEQSDSEEEEMAEDLFVIDTNPSTKSKQNDENEANEDDLSRLESTEDQALLNPATSPLKKKRLMKVADGGEPKECSDGDGEDEIQKHLGSALSLLKKKRLMKVDDGGEPEECSDDDGEDEIQKHLGSALSPLKKKRLMEDDCGGKPEECSGGEGEDQKSLDSASSPLKRRRVTKIDNEVKGEPKECNDEDEDEESASESASRKKTKVSKKLKVKRESLTEATPVKMATRRSTRMARKSYSAKK